MADNGDAALIRVLHTLVTDLLEWLEECPEDDVDRAALAAVRDSVAWVVWRLPAEQRRRLEELTAGDGGPAAAQGSDIDAALLGVVIGLLIDVVWWLEASADDEVELHTAVKQLENVAYTVGELPNGQQRRLIDVIAELTATEQHPRRRYELLAFPFATGLVEEEPDEDRPPGDWVHAAARLLPQ